MRLHSTTRLPANRHAALAAVAALVLAVTCRILWVAYTDGHDPSGDADDYDFHARSIAQGDGYPPSLVGGPAAHRPPGYPYFLAALYKVTGDSALSARYAQALLGAVAVGLVGLLAWRIWDVRLALIAMTIAAVFPPLVVSSTTLISEALVVPLVLASILAVCEARRGAHRWLWIGASGVLAGLVALTRPNGFLLLIPLGIAAWKTSSEGPRLAAVRVALLLAAAALTVAPWTIRNAVRLDAFVPVSTGTGFTVAGTYNDTSAHFYYPGTWLPPFYDRKLAAYFPPRERLGRGVGPGEVVLDRRLRAEAREYIREHPGYVAKVAGKNLLRLFGMSGEPANVIDPEEPRGTARLVRWSLYAVLALALIGIFTRKRRRAPWYFWLVPALFATAVFVVAWMRFRAPIDPFLILLAALALDAGWRQAVRYS